jgi:hypothetical protein
MRKRLLILLSVLLLSTLGWSWGREGHHIIASIAEDHLDETTKVMIQSLIGNNHLYSIAAWADEVRKERSQTGPWHYVDIPLGSTYEAGRDCALPHNCVVVKLDELIMVLTNKQASHEDRAEALKFIVHFMGDIHQPMHAVGEARGGNGIHVRFLGNNRCGPYECNLHGVWDSSLIQHTGVSRQEYVTHEEELIQMQRLEIDADGKPAEWANDSARLAQAAWVPEGTDLDEAYYTQKIKVVDRQLALAGLRLAKLLNLTIGKLTPQDFKESSPIKNAAEKSAILSTADPSLPNGTSSEVTVWVNTSSKAYHCPGTRWYGNTKTGQYMTQSAALAKGYHPAGSRACP